MARVYKRIIKITGYGEFEKIVNVSTNGTFSVLCPEFIVKDGITQMEHLYAQNLKDLEKKFNEAKNQFEDLQYDFKEVILYRIYEKKDSSDGSGAGFVFNWGVFRKLNKPNSNRKQDYFFVRGGGKREISESWHSFKEWKEVDYSDKIENFFSMITDNIDSLYEKLFSFLNQDLTKVDDFRLID